jgi:hypothetical protein
LRQQFSPVFDYRISTTPTGLPTGLLPVISHANGVAHVSGSIGGVTGGVTTGGVRRLRVGNPVGVWKYYFFNFSSNPFSRNGSGTTCL